MKRSPGVLASLILGANLLLLGCTQAAPSSPPTSPPAAPTKVVEPTKAAAAAPTTAPVAPTKAAAPTAAPAKKVDYPAGRAITYLVPFAPGGSTDISARILAPLLEKELGTSVQVVNKPGGNTQVGMTELTKARPDGYTIGTVDVPSVNITYLLPERGATYTRKDFQPLWMYFVQWAVWQVKADSPYKSVKDVVDAAKASPGAVKVGDTGLMGPYHLANVGVAKAAGVQFSLVHFDGGGPTTTALLGGHIDVGISSPASATSQVKSGQTRLIAVFGKERNPFFPEVKTMEEQGYKVLGGGAFYPIAGPTGMPKEITDILTPALKKVTALEELKKKADEASLTLLPMTPAEIDPWWAEQDRMTQELLEAAK